MAQRQQAPKRRRARRLKRIASHPTLPVETAHILCIRGVSRRSWLVLPTQDLHGRACAPLSTRMCWLHQLLGGSARRRLYCQPVAVFLRECVEAFRAADGPAPSAGLEPSATVESPAPRKVGKAAILSGSEDESDAERDAAAPRAPKKLAVPRRPRLGEFVTRQVRGFELTFTVGRGPRVLVPTDGPFIERIVQDLRPRAGEGTPTSPASSQEGLTDSASSQDKGRVFWRGCGYQICYQDAKGKRHMTRAGLSMPRRGLTHEELSPEEALATKASLKDKARREWDRLDQSRRKRFFSPSAGFEPRRRTVGRRAGERDEHSGAMRPPPAVVRGNPGRRAIRVSGGSRRRRLAG